MKANILNPAWKYTPSGQTDIRKSRQKWLREYCRDYDAAVSENAFRDMVPVNLSVLTIRKGSK